MKNERLSCTELSQKLKKVTSLSDPLLREYQNDSRLSVQQLLKTNINRINKQNKLLSAYQQKWIYENKLRAGGAKIIAGIDEVGRGSLAGPVVACAVILPKLNDFDHQLLIGLDDSKKLSKTKREHFAQIIKELAISIGIGIIEPQIIDQINIYQATKRAMIQAVNNLSRTPDQLLIDAMKLEININQESLIKGDSKSISIAATSVVAKVTRDQIMTEFAKQYPHYGFEHNAGYGTKIHLQGIKNYGITPLHRRTFAPIKERF